MLCHVYCSGKLGQGGFIKFSPQDLGDQVFLALATLSEEERGAQGWRKANSTTGSVACWLKHQWLVGLLPFTPYLCSSIRGMRFPLQLHPYA